MALQTWAAFQATPLAGPSSGLEGAKLVCQTPFVTVRTNQGSRSYSVTGCSSLSHGCCDVHSSKSSFFSGDKAFVKSVMSDLSSRRTNNRTVSNTAAGSAALSTAEYIVEDVGNATVLPRQERLYYNSEDSEVESEEEISTDSDVDPEDELAIANLGVMDELVDALANRGIKRLFPIQRAVLQPAMEGRDLIARAKTGTGKTLAFGIPIIESILRENEEDRAARRPGRTPRCIVLAPTRELAKQVEREFIESAPTLSTVCVYGGVGISGQERLLKRGVDVAVGTPGRIQDLLERGALNLSTVRFVVLDEADQMLAVGFEEDVENILNQCPTQRQTVLFSATMPSWVKKLSRKYLSNPLTVDLVGDSEEKLADSIKLYAVRTPATAKRSILSDLITIYGRGGKSIIFTQTKREADEVSAALGRTVGCEALHGDIAQLQREKTLAAFRDGRFSALVATDVAARGLDIPSVELVVHYELPNDPETFVHRSGRTGRAGKTGVVILMHTETQTRSLRMIERDTGATFERMTPPAKDEVLQASADQAVNVLSRVEADLREVFLPTAERLLEERGAHALAAALAHMSGYTEKPSSRSLLTHEEGWMTLRIVRSATSRNGPLSSARTVMGALAEMYRPAADSVGKIRMISERNVEGAVFDVPEKIAKEVLALNFKNGDIIDFPKQLPPVVEESFGRSGDSRGARGGGSRGGSYGGRGGPPGRYGGGGGGSFGDRDIDRYGDRGARSQRGGRRDSWDEGDSLFGGGGRRGERSFDGVCFVCKKPGHRANDCPSGGGRR
eukprot:TRINITY_DN1998_c1_g3_i1.p1 TRINITY_DN1998_c1_g3~~TRINITY_DN1998_c1_g3_i1.p1  ORF type:complete len:789 (+),score=198.16 TRINITY_DN1998_c1_g3_i1:158-2524(+)